MPDEAHPEWLEDLEKIPLDSRLRSKESLKLKQQPILKKSVQYPLLHHEDHVIAVVLSSRLTLSFKHFSWAIVHLCMTCTFENSVHLCRLNVP